MRKSPSLPALEKNILKFRALQMVLFIYEVESLRKWLIESLSAHDAIFKKQAAKQANKLNLQAASQRLVLEKILTNEEASRLKELVDIRNEISHSIHFVLQDIAAPKNLRTNSQGYDYRILSSIRKLRTKIETGLMSRGFLQTIGFSGIQFEQARLTYQEELERLNKKIVRQLELRRVEIGA